MAINMLFFDFRDNEQDFFKTHDLEHFNITFYRESLNEQTVETLSFDKLDNTSVISVFTTSNVTAGVISKFKNLRIISTRSTAYDHISQTAANRRNISIINVEKYGSSSVAQYTFGLITALVRKLLPASKYLKDKKCNENLTGRNLADLTLGVVGTGAIGSNVCKIGKFFDMNVIAYDIHPKQELINDINIKYVELNDLIKHSDIISLHLPYTGDNYHMFSEKEFKMMKDGAYFINTSAGETVDTHALYNALVIKKLSGTALDVLNCEDNNFRCENLVNNNIPLDCVQEEEAVKKLIDMDNAIITPHIAYATKDAINYILAETFKAIRDSIKGRTSNVNY